MFFGRKMFKENNSSLYCNTFRVFITVSILSAYLLALLWIICGFFIIETQNNKQSFWYLSIGSGYHQNVSTLKIETVST